MIKHLFTGEGAYAGYTWDIGTIIQAFNNLGQYVGCYNKDTDQTFDSNGSLIQMKGMEALGFLIYSNYQQ